MKPKSSRSHSKKGVVHSKVFALPTRRNSPDPIFHGWFTWKLNPVFPAHGKRIILTCAVCSKIFVHSWPINTTTLKEHFNKNHLTTRGRITREALESSTPNDETTLESSLSGQYDSYQCLPSIDNVFSSDTTDSGTSQQQMSSNANGPSFLAFDPAEHTRLVLMMIVANNLPHSLVDSDTFKAHVLYLRGDAPSISRSTLKRNLTGIYESETLKMKETFAANTSLFALTIDESRSSDEFDFLKIVLHFYSNSCQKETYTIGFEALDKHLSYTGKVLYDCLIKVLRDYGIENRIISITRDNAGPMNSMMDYFRRGTKGSGIDFHGDIQCIGHILNLSIKGFLEFTYFKKSSSKDFKESIANIEEEHPEFGYSAERMSTLPNAMRFIILKIRYNQEMRSVFMNLVEEKKKKESTSRYPEKIMADKVTGWLSTYKMIDRFIYFREEITKVLKYALRDGKLSDTDRGNFEITENDWSYLKSVRDVLDEFRLPTIRLQATSCPTIQQTISLVYGTLCALDSPKLQELCPQNPYFVMGLEAAKSKLLQYFPIYNEDITSNKMLYIAVVLEPRFKLAVFEPNGFTNPQIEAIKNAFVDVYEQYKKKYEDTTDECTILDDDATSVRAAKHGFGFGFAKRASKINLESEVDKYFREPREPEYQDAMAFYMSRKTIYPILYCMARDYFAVPAISAPTESLVSGVSDMATKKRNRLSPGSRKMMAILKSRGAVDIEVGTDDELDAEEGAEGEDICSSNVGVDDGLLLIDNSEFAAENTDELELLAQALAV